MDNRSPHAAHHTSTPTHDLRLRCNRALVQFNESQHPSARIRRTFPLARATSHRDYALRVNYGRAITRSLAQQINTITERIAVIEKKHFLTPKDTIPNQVVFRVCGCCMDPSHTFTLELARGVQGWACCFVAWLLITPWSLITPAPLFAQILAVLEDFFLLMLHDFDVFKQIIDPDNNDTLRVLIEDTSSKSVE